MVYPPQGAGIIREIVEREVLGKTAQYFRIDFVRGDIAVLVPLDKAEQVGLRKAVDATEVPLIRSALVEGDISMPESWQARNRMQKEIVDQGYAHRVAHLIGAMEKRHGERGLASTEFELFQAAKQLLAAELTLALDLPWQESSPELLTNVVEGTVG